jgi:hypothetical protein
VRVGPLPHHLATSPAGPVDSLCRPAPETEAGLTSQGTARGRFTRAVHQRNLFAAQIAHREMRDPSLAVALDYLELLADVKPEKLEPAAVRGHGRLEVEAASMTLAAAPHER